MAKEIKNNQELQEWFLKYCKENSGCVVLTEREFNQIKIAFRRIDAKVGSINKLIKYPASRIGYLCDEIVDIIGDLFIDLSEEK